MDQDQNDNNPQNELSDEDFADVMRESSELSAPVTSTRAERFYDKMRERIRNYLEKKGSVAGKTGEYLMLAPDVFVLLWRLVNDPRVASSNKVALGSGIAYFLFPLDITPEAFFGPIGYIDDLIFGVLLLKKTLVDTDAAVLRDHWSGSEDVLTTIEKILASAEQIAGSELVNRFKRTVK
ncbi:MAG TPA: DUF1232 domain-containing protein [Thermoanaerobaculia bacterium]|jgi:uncharacterized membrane protein YkvA (DUF1232 family)|nr:DUF1232 domain-containing protein [Thermoanaerobaculia bacterium]